MGCQPQLGGFISRPASPAAAHKASRSLQGNPGEQQTTGQTPNTDNKASNCGTMKAAVVFVLLFATVLCRPARKVSLSSSESSEEAARRPAPPVQRKQAQVVPQARAAPVQAPSQESSEEEELAKDDSAEVKSDSVDTTAASDTTSVNSESDEDDDSDETEENDPQEEDEEDDSSDSSDSESGEASPASPTDIPALVTEEPVTEDPFEPTVITDTDSGRGDSFAGYPSDYKSIIYEEDKSYHKSPDYYKSYEFVDSGKKSAYGTTDGNDVEKSLKVYKVQAFHVHSDFLEEDTSTPEVESQGLDTLSGPAGDQNLNPRQAYLPEEDSPTEATTSDSSSGQTEEEEEEESASTSQESQDEDSESSEEATATPGAADSDSDESEDSEGDSEEAAVDTVTDTPVVVAAK